MRRKQHCFHILYRSLHCLFIRSTLIFRNNIKQKDKKAKALMLTSDNVQRHSQAKHLDPVVDCLASLFHWVYIQ